MPERVTLRFVEDGKEIGAAKENQRSDIVQRVEKSDCGGDQNERDHQAGPRLVNAAEQPIESDRRDR